MSFWNNSQFEIKRSFRWLVDLPSVRGYKSFLAAKVEKPSFSIGETTHTYLNHKFYYPGQITWNDVTVTLVDAVDPDMAAGLYDALASSGYALPTNENVLGTISKNKAVQALGPEVRIQQLKAEQNILTAGAGTPKIAETWTLINPWIKDVKFGSLDYSSEDMVMIDLTIKYDFARHDGGAA